MKVDKSNTTKIAEELQDALADMFDKKCPAKILNPVGALGAKCLYVTNYESKPLDDSFDGIFF